MHHKLFFLYYFLIFIPKYTYSYLVQVILFLHSFHEFSRYLFISSFAHLFYNSICKIRQSSKSFLFSPWLSYVWLFFLNLYDWSLIFLRLRHMFNLWLSWLTIALLHLWWVKRFSRIVKLLRLVWNYGRIRCHFQFDCRNLL